MGRDLVIAGAGTMGIGIAGVAAAAGFHVYLGDVSPEVAERGLMRSRDLLTDSVKRGKITQAAATCARQKLRPIGDWQAVPRGPLLAIEAVPERADLKRAVLAQLEMLEPELLATNTSGISVDELAGDLRHPERFLGMHFFNPVPAMRLVEIVKGARTSEAAQAAALLHVGALGKEPIVVQDSPGFASSRLGVALGLEAIRMLETQVASAADIDRAMELGYRYPIGPLRLTDLVGLDVRLDIARNLASEYGPRFSPPRLLEEMVAEGRLGRKTGQGFYSWPAQH